MEKGEYGKRLQLATEHLQEVLPRLVEAFDLNPNLLDGAMRLPKTDQLVRNYQVVSSLAIIADALEVISLGILASIPGQEQPESVSPETVEEDSDPIPGELPSLTLEEDTGLIPGEAGPPPLPPRREKLNKKAEKGKRK